MRLYQFQRGRIFCSSQGSAFVHDKWTMRSRCRDKVVRPQLERRSRKKGDLTEVPKKMKHIMIQPTQRNACHEPFQSEYSNAGNLALCMRQFVFVVVFFFEYIYLRFALNGALQLMKILAGWRSSTVPRHLCVLGKTAVPSSAEFPLRRLLALAVAWALPRHLAVQVVESRLKWAFFSV